jgi:hypothetical protein
MLHVHESLRRENPFKKSGPRPAVKGMIDVAVLAIATASLRATS